MSPRPDRSIRFYDALASDYDERMREASSNDWARSAFHDWVTRIAPPPARILDFGAGTGIDALRYAELGYDVTALDNSPGMVAQLVMKLGGQASRPSVRALVGTLESCAPTIQAVGSFDAVVSNFAVLNLIEDLSPTFAQLAEILRPSGHLLVSVLNPMFWKDWRERWLWAGLVRSLGKGTIHLRGRDTDVYRHRVSTMVEKARPHFVLRGRASVGALIRRVRGRHDWRSPSGLAERFEHRFWRTAPMTSLGQYFFLAFERRS
jgi:SAM-dependent methyltransferase